MKKVFMFFIVIAFCWQLESTTLKEAIARAEKLSANLEQARLDLQLAELKIEDASRGRFFTIGLAASYFFKSEQPEMTFPETVIGQTMVIPAKAISVGSLHNFDLKVSLTQPLYTGGVLRSLIKKAQAGKLAEEASIQSRKLEVAAAVKLSYFNYRLLQQKRLSLIALRQSLTLRRDKLQALISEEQVRKSDLLETETKIYEVDLAISEIDARIKIEEAQFFKLCAMLPGEIDQEYCEASFSYAESLDHFQKNHPLLKKIFCEEQALTIKKRQLKEHTYLKLHSLPKGITPSRA